MKQSAVEWLANELLNKYHLKIDNYKEFKQAKEMEKQQIKDAWNDVYGHIKDADEYYNETFKSE